MSKANIGFTNLNADDLLTKGKQVYTAMTANVATFATPNPVLTVLSGNIDDLEAAINAYNAAGGGKVLRAAKDAAKKPLEATLYQLGLYVQKTSNGVESVILQAGFDVSKPKIPSSELSSPENFRLTTSGKGRMRLKVNPVKGAKSYTWEYKQVAATVWDDRSTTAANVLLEDLESGKEYVFRVTAVGANPVRNYSIEVSSFVL